MKKVLLVLTIFACSTVGWAVPSHSQSTAGITAGSAAALTLTLSGVTVGERLVFAYGITSNTITATVQESCGDSITFPSPVSGSNPKVTAIRTVAIGYTTTTCSGSVSLTITPSGLTSLAAAAATIDNAGSLEFATIDESTTGSSVTTTTADYVWSMGVDMGVNGTSLSNGSGFTQFTGSTQCPSFPCGDEGKLEGAAGSDHASWTYSGGDFFTLALFIKPISTSYAVLTPATMAFGTEIIGSTTATQTATLQNAGAATLNISSIGLVTGTQFSEPSTTCGGTLAANASCTISIRFSPSASGIFTDSLRVVSDSPTSPNSIATQGQGSILDPSRSIPWYLAGTQDAGSCSTRSTSCSSLNSSATLAQINNAIAACPSGQKVSLGVGSYGPYSGEIIWNNTSGVSLCGAGANQTTISFLSCGNGNGLGACVYAQNGDADYSGGPSNVCNWTAGYAQGSNTITMGSCPTGSSANLKVGTLIILDQLDDASDPGSGLVVCQSSGAGNCTSEGSSGANGGRAGRAQNQQVVVTAINGSSITISPGLYAPNWASGKTPQFWFSNSLPITGVTLENMTIDASTVTAQPGGIVMFDNTYNSLVNNVRTLNNTGNANARHKHYWLYQSSHVTISNSYMYGSAGASESYGVDSSFSSSDNLIVNNICQQIASCMITEGDAGSVFAYNFSPSNYYTAGGSNFQQCDSSHHGAEDMLTLWEGNQALCMSLDDTHGFSFGETAFRNWYKGRDGTKTTQTVPFEIWKGSRYVNLIGNVAGTASYHTTYEYDPASTTDCGSLATGNTSVFTFGWSQLGGTRYATISTCPSGLGSGFDLTNDTSLAGCSLRWGNYDTVNATSRFQNGEIPNGCSPYGNAIPGNQTLPASFIYSSKPSFFGSITWPASGPDVTGGNVSGLGGHVNMNPAMNCYTNIMGGPADGSGSALSFNQAGCYSASGPVASLDNLSLAFGNQRINVTSSAQSVTLTNAGSSTLSISSIALTTGTQFAISSNTCGATLAVNTSCVVSVTFTPTSGGSKTDTLVFTDNDPNSPQNVSLAGTGVAAVSDVIGASAFTGANVIQ